jgi:hypothetical protein
MCVDRACDGEVGASCLVLVDDRGAFAVVAHPGHQVPQARAAGCQMIAGVPEVVKVEAFGADGLGACGQADILLKLLRAFASRVHVHLNSGDA